MSQHLPARLTCPNCGHEQEVDVWSSLNTTLDPHAREILLAGQLNVIECEDCRVSTPIAAQFLYHDMDNGFAVQFYPWEMMEHPDFPDMFRSDGGLQIPGASEIDGELRVPGVEIAVPHHLARPHIVFDMNELIRYVVFREMLLARGPSDDV